MEYDYQPAEYFFDANWTGFAAILMRIDPVIFI
jgi:hypothetical protein